MMTWMKVMVVILVAVVVGDVSGRSVGGGIADGSRDDGVMTLNSNGIGGVNVYMSGEDYVDYVTAEIFVAICLSSVCIR